MNYKTIFLCLFGIIVFGLAVYFLYYKEKKIEQFDNAYSIIESERILPTIEPNAMFTVKSFSTIYGVQQEQLNYMSSLTNYVGGDIGGVRAFVQGDPWSEAAGHNPPKYDMINPGVWSCSSYPIIPNNILGLHNFSSLYDNENSRCTAAYTFYFDYYSDPTSDFPTDYLRWRGQATNLIDKKIRGFLRYPLWDYADINYNIVSYEGLPELDGYTSYYGIEDDGFHGYQITHTGFQAYGTYYAYRLTGSLAAYQPQSMKSQNIEYHRLSLDKLDKYTQITNATNEMLQIHLYASNTTPDLLTTFSNDFAHGIHWGSALNFSDVNKLDMYINVPYFQTFSGIDAHYSYGLFYPEMRQHSATDAYNYVLDSSGALWNTMVKSLNNGTQIISNLAVTQIPITYDSNGIGTWNTLTSDMPSYPVNSLSFLYSFYYFNTIYIINDPFTIPTNPSITDLEKIFVGKFDGPTLGLMPQTQRRYIRSFIYNRTQRLLSVYLGEIAKQPKHPDADGNIYKNIGNTVSVYNSIAPQLNGYNTDIKELDKANNSFNFEYNGDIGMGQQAVYDEAGTGNHNQAYAYFKSINGTLPLRTVIVKNKKYYLDFDYETPENWQPNSTYGQKGTLTPLWHIDGGDNIYGFFNSDNDLSNIVWWSDINPQYLLSNTNNIVAAWSSGNDVADYMIYYNKYGSDYNVQTQISNSWVNVTTETIAQLGFLYACIYQNLFLDSNGSVYSNIQPNSFSNLTDTYTLPSNIGDDGFIQFTMNTNQSSEVDWIDSNYRDVCFYDIYPRYYMTRFFPLSNIPNNIFVLKYIASLLPYVDTCHLNGLNTQTNVFSNVHFFYDQTNNFHYPRYNNTELNYNINSTSINAITSGYSNFIHFKGRSGNLQTPKTDQDLKDVLNAFNSAMFQIPITYGPASNVNVQNKPMLNSIAQYFYDKSQGHYEMSMIYDVFQIGSNMLDIRYDKLQRLDSLKIQSLEVQYAPEVKKYNTLLNMYFDNTWQVNYSNSISNYQNDLNLAQSNIAAILNPIYPLSNANATDLSNTISYLTYINSNIQNAIEGQPINTTVTTSATVFGATTDINSTSNISITQAYSSNQLHSIQVLQDQIGSNTDIINNLTNQLTGILTNVARIFYTITGTDSTGNAIIQINAMAFGLNACLSYNPAYNASLQTDSGLAQGNVNYSPAINYDYNVIKPINCADVDFMKEVAQTYMDGIYNNLSSFTSNVYQVENGDVRVAGIRGFSNIDSNTCGYTWDEVQYDYYTNIANVNRTVNVVIPFKYDNSIYQNPLLMIDNSSNGKFKLSSNAITEITAAEYYPWYQTGDLELNNLNSITNIYYPYINYLANVKTYGDNLRFILVYQYVYSLYLRDYLFGEKNFNFFLLAKICLVSISIIFIAI